MKGLIRYLFLICMFFIVGCNEREISNYDDHAVAAIVRGEEITVGDLRFLYPDEKILEYLDGTIKAKLAEQEIRKLNLDMSQKLQEIQELKNTIGVYPPEEDDTEMANDTREFAESQSSKLGMEPEEYYEKYFEQAQESSVYVTAYVEEMLGEPQGDGEEYTKKANELLDKLAEENEEEIKILIE